MKKLVLFALSLIFLTTTSNLKAQQQETYTFCTGSSYSYLLDTATTSTSTYFARWNIGSTAYVAHFQNDTIYQTTGTGGGGGAYGTIKKWACTSNSAATCVWTYTLSNAHHDICPLPNGNVLAIVDEIKTSAQIQAAGGTYSSSANFPKIQEIHPTGSTTGTVVWEWKLWDHMCSTSVSTNPQLLNIALVTSSDFCHMNGIDYNPDLNQIVCSSHMLNEVYIIDHSTTTAQAATHTGGNAGKGGDFLYRWGRPQNYGCTSNGNGITLNVIHDARWIPSTNSEYPNCISFFHNGGCNGGHGAVIFQPPHNGYNYTYTPGSVIGPTSCTTPTTPSFSVGSQGGCNVLENGNILITNPGVKFFECNGTGTTYQQISVTTTQSDRLKKCEVRYPNTSATVSDNSVCTNATITLGSSATSVMETSPTYTYSWISVPAGFTSSSQNPTATPTTAGNYTYVVTITNNVGCTGTASVNVTVNDCSDVEESALEKTELVIYPNPTTGIVSINENFANDDYQVYICNSFGTIIIQESNAKRLDLSDFPAGIYYINIKTEKINLIKKIILIK
jgi:hypothetical protein